MGLLLWPWLLLLWLCYVFICIVGYFTVYYFLLHLLGGISLPILAKRRGIKHGWLAWLPGGADWVLGAIADDTREKILGRAPGMRKLLPALSIVLACAIVFCIFAAVGVVLTINFDGGDADLQDIVCAVFQICLVVGVGIALLVFYTRFFMSHIAFYCIFESCNPRAALLLSVLGILFGAQISILFCMKKDLGLPSAAPVPEIAPEHAPEA